MDDLKLGPAMRTDDGMDYESSPLNGDLASAILQISAGDGVDQVTFAKGLPMQAVLHIQQDLIGKWRPSSALRGAVEDFHDVFVLCSGGMRDNDDRVAAVTKIALPDIPWLHRRALRFLMERIAAVANSIS